MPHHHLSLAYARILFRHLRLTEQNGDKFFCGTSLDYAALMALDAEVPFEVQSRLFSNALAISQEPELGLSVGRSLHLPSHGPLGVAAFSSPTLATALDCLARYSAMRAQFVDLTLTKDASQIVISMHETLDLGDIRCFLHESVISAIYAAVVFFAGGAIRGHIEFAYAPTGYADAYARYFEVPYQFGCPHTRLCLDASLMQLPSPVADPVLHAQAIAQCENEMRALGEAASVRERVAMLISRNPGRLWSGEEMARELNMSARTLLRKLKAEGTSFQSVRDDIVMGLAKTYLLDKSMTVELTGHLLGFSDVASFRRSFKRVVGQTPADFIAGMRRG